MSRRKIQQTLTELDRQIQELQATGNQAEETIARGRKAALYASMQEWAAAATEFDLAAQVAASAKEVFVEAQSRYAQGLALENLPEQRETAQESFRRAADLFEISGHQARVVQAHQRIAALNIAAGKTQDAVEEITAVIDQLDGPGQPQLLIELYRTRANTHLLGERFDQALADLKSALVIAQRSGDDKLVLQVQVELTVLQSLQTGDYAPDLFSTFLQQAQQMGNLPLTSDLQIQQAASALQSGNYKKALRKADAARQAALQADDLARYLRYLIACLVIAAARENLRDRPGVLAILMTCKKTLEQHLGREVGQMMNQVLDALAIRWGKEGLTEALRVYRERVQEQGPGNVKL